ncbi:hypothetical protein JTB14_007346 [Gonioctena quinquepunctata]|nr:hypothetical protein JTB14_007346 [Gonioctena quinquepunctata]
MLGSEQNGLSVGRNALSWILGHADVWYLLLKCATFVSKKHAQFPHNTVSILETLLMPDEGTEEEEEEEEGNREELGDQFSDIFRQGKFLFWQISASSFKTFISIFDSDTVVRIA